MTVVGEESFRSKIIDAVKYLYVNKLRSVLIENEYMYLRVLFEGFDRRLSYEIEIKNTENYLIVLSSVYAHIYMVSANKLISRINQRIMSGVSGDIGVCGDIEEKGFGLILPYKKEYIRRRDICDVVELNGSLLFKCKSGKIVKVII